MFIRALNHELVSVTLDNIMQFKPKMQLKRFESLDVEVPAIAAVAEIPVIAAVADVEANESEADESDVTSADQRAEPMLSGADAIPSDTDTEEAPANDAESPASTGTSPETPAWGGAARPSFLA